MTPENGLFRDDAGKLVFRPGGHGASHREPNDIDSTVVFVKNIDNVVPDTFHRASTVEYKKLLSAVCPTPYTIWRPDFIARLSVKPNVETVEEATDFVEGTLCYISKDLDEALPLATRAFENLIKVLDCPFRVCGMVRNEGELPAAALQRLCVRRPLGGSPNP